jgi:hypothetical protein
MSLFKWLGRCCCKDCPPCPFPNQSRRGWTSRPIDGCTQCPCPPCPFPFAGQTGYTTAFNPYCPVCPRCEDDPCYITGSPGLACPCLPQRFLVVVAGVSECPCFIDDTGLIDPRAHFETLGSPDGAYCFDGVTPPTPPSVTQRQWGNDGPPDCEAPTTLVSSGTGGSITASVSFGGGIITVQVTVDGPLAPMFCGRMTSSNCAGPWIVGNQLIPGCSFELSGITGFCSPLFPGTPYLIGGSGGTATVYPCGC